MSDPVLETTRESGSGQSAAEAVNPISLMIARFAAAVAVSDHGEAGIAQLETTEILQFLFTTLADLSAGDSLLSLSLDNPGHLTAKVGECILYIPYHLVDELPSGEALRYIVEQADALRIFTDSTICLSGSAAFGIEVASDIDFCEYVPHTGKRVAQSFLAKGSRGLPFCIGVKHNKQKVEYPWNEASILHLCRTDTGRIGGKCTCAKRDWLFDYVGALADRTPIPLSNKCVHEDDAEMLSSPYQEIAITAKPQPVTYLATPRELGKYVLRLRREINDYRAARPDKALKRALSLARILYLIPVSDRILELLRSSAFRAMTRKHIACEMQTTIDKLPETMRSSFEITVLPVDDAVEQSGEQSFALLDDLVSQYDALMARARRLVGTTS
jgi:hypothetical protein